MPKLILTQGIPGSGKTTWAREWLSGAENGRARVSRDDIRYSIFGVYHGTDERLIDVLLDNQMDILMRARMDIVLDATNTHPMTVDRYRRRANMKGYSFEVKRFDIDLEEAIRRDALRDRSVGREVITLMYEKMMHWDYELQVSRA